MDCSEKQKWKNRWYHIKDNLCYDKIMVKYVNEKNVFESKYNVLIQIWSYYTQCIYTLIIDICIT